ncbi:hypothetical protein ACV3V0_05870 [Clostridium perfringens]
MCAKRKRIIDGNIVSKRIAEGRGKGEKSEYRPWTTIQDMSSLCIATRHSSWKHNVVLHLLSELEANYFYMLGWSDKVIDIRKRFPLEDMKKAQEIAKYKGIKYLIDSFSI